MSLSENKAMLKVPINCGGSICSKDSAQYSTSVFRPPSGGFLPHMEPLTSNKIKISCRTGPTQGDVLVCALTLPATATINKMPAKKMHRKSNRGLYNGNTVRRQADSRTF